MAKISWDDVSAQTITNCFIKCGFNKNIQITNEVQNDDENELWEQAKDIIDSKDINFQDFVNADDDLITTNEFDLNETLRLLKSSGGTQIETVIDTDSDTEIEQEKESEEEEIENVNSIPSFSEVSNAIDQVKLYLIKLDLDNESIKMIDKIEDVIVRNRVAISKQTQITDFFNKNR